MVTKLLVGHQRFRRDFFQHERELFESFARGVHAPTTLLIGCCDARVVPHFIMRADPGELFILRNIANLVPQYGEGHHRSVGSAIEYAVHALEVPHIIICGHTQCGGLKALLEGPDKLADAMPTLAMWLKDAEELRDRLAELLRDHPLEEIAHQLVYENVAVQLENLLTYPVVERALAAGKLQLHGWVYELSDGSLLVYDPETNEFGPSPMLELPAF
jgi:carbonic anhydrase